MTMRVLFFGTPQIAVPFLEHLSKNLVGVVCRPDEPVGRGMKLTAPPAKQFADAHKIPVFQPHGPWTDEQTAAFKALKADVGVAVAYGRILPEAVFQAPRLGTFNIHFSLLPKYRGAAPMQWALMNGETKTGVSAFWLETGLDSGPVIDKEEVAIAPDDDVFTLRKKLVDAGVLVLSRVMTQLRENGRVPGWEQTGEATFAPILKKDTGRIDWTQPAVRIANLIRGVREWPGAVTGYRTPTGERKALKILAARALSDDRGEPGTIADVTKNGFVVNTGGGRLEVLSVQPEGKKEMSALDFWRGARIATGDQLV